MCSSLFKSRYSVILFVYLVFLTLSFLLRLGLVLDVGSELDQGIIQLLSVFLFGLFYDMAIVSCFVLPMGILLSIIPQRIQGSVFDKVIVYGFTTLYFIIFYFSFFSEITFWQEFKSRFNFIAVDYLIYTYEVIKNIQESYPLQILIPGVLLLSLITVFVGIKFKFYHNTFTSKATFKLKAISVGLNILLALGLIYFLDNNTSSLWQNRYNNEISKSGIFSFFSAFRNNHLLYQDHYKTIDIDSAFSMVQKQLKDSKTLYDIQHVNPIFRTIKSGNANLPEQKPNVIFVLMESMSASFLQQEYKGEPITKNLNQLAQNSVWFKNMFASGTRTVRGMEAVVLSIVPTPGHSIVKRVNNQGLYSVSSVFKEKGYHNMFFYGGDGYFDNMNSFFGGNGFDIYDRGRGSVLSDKIPANRYNIQDDEVSFENAWGICDQDIYNKVISVFDQKANQNQPLFAFVMTTSNHRPYTYPDSQIDIESGQGRQGAVKYADYAIGEFLQKAKQKPWFDQTVFVFIADHCASSAGGSVIDVDNYHIPAFIYNAPMVDKMIVDKETAQIDIFPTLFSIFNWNYRSGFYGKDILDPQYESRSFLATYIQLGMKKDKDVMVLSDQNKVNQYLWKDGNLILKDKQEDFQKEIISNYQTADYLYLNGLLNER
ncbi:LTA synthase family protein [Myroides sp. LJL110]